MGQGSRAPGAAGSAHRIVEAVNDQSQATGSWIVFKPIIDAFIHAPASGGRQYSRLKQAGRPAESGPSMSKPGLGRGLGSLLSGGRTTSTGEVGPIQPAEGVQLLLRGTDGSELVPPVPQESGESGPALPRWALAGALVVDLVLLGVAVWAVVGHRGWGRLLVAVLLLGVGAFVLGVAVWIRGQPAIRELASLNPLTEEPPRLRIRFMDEGPKR